MGRGRVRRVEARAAGREGERAGAGAGGRWPELVGGGSAGGLRAMRTGGKEGLVSRDSGRGSAKWRGAWRRVDSVGRLWSHGEEWKVGSPLPGRAGGEP